MPGAAVAGVFSLERKVLVCYDLDLPFHMPHPVLLLSRARPLLQRVMLCYRRVTGYITITPDDHLFEARVSRKCVARGSESGAVGTISSGFVGSLAIFDSVGFCYTGKKVDFEKRFIAGGLIQRLG